MKWKKQKPKLKYDVSLMYLFEYKIYKSLAKWKKIENCNWYGELGKTLDFDSCSSGPLAAAVIVV